MRVVRPQPTGTPQSRTRTITERFRLLAPSRLDLIDATFLFALCAVALLGFATTFDSLRFWWVGLVGVLVGIVWAHVANVLRWPAAAAIGASLVCYFLLGGPLAVPDETAAGFLPTVASASTLGLLTVTGWKELLTILAPLEGGSPYLALVLLLALVAGSAGFAAARRSRRPAYALMVPGSLFVMVTALGTLDPGAPLLQGLGLAVLAFGWLASRHPRRRRMVGSGGRPGPVRLALAAGMLAAALAVGTFLGPMLPGASGAPRQVLRTYVQPPIDLSQYPSPLVGFRLFSSEKLRAYYDKPLLQVNGLPANSLLRLATMDEYTGAVWTATGDLDDPLSGFQRLGGQVPNAPTQGLISADIEVLPAFAGNNDVNAWLPGLGATAQVTFTGAQAKQHAASYRFNLDTSQGFVPDRLRSGDRLTVVSAPLPLFGSLPSDAEPGDAHQTDDAASEFLATTTEKLAGGASQPLERLKAAADELRGGAWSDGTKEGEQQYLPGHGRYRLTMFSSSRQFVGSDEQYAAAFALIANRIGFPARTVLGATVPDGGTIQGRDVKAWVEIQVARDQWVTVPTEVFTPDRNKKPDETVQENDDQTTATNVPPPNPVRPPGSFGDMMDTEPASNRIEKPADSLFWKLFWLVFGYVAPPLGIVLAVVGLILGAKARRRHLRRTRGPLSSRVAGGWSEVLDTLRDLGRPVPARLTRLEQSAQLGRADVHQLAGEANAAIFGADLLDDSVVEGYWNEVTTTRRAMLAERGWFARTIAMLSLRSFLPLRRPRPSRPLPVLPTPRRARV